MLKRKQALRAAGEDLELEMEIAKTEAREKALSEIDKEHEAPLSPHGSGPPSVTASFTPIVLKSATTSSPDNVVNNHKPLASCAAAEMKSAITTVASSLPRNPAGADFTPGMFADAILSTPFTGNGLETSKGSNHEV